MGDRGNVKIVSQYSDPIYLYTHWGGYELPETVKAALITARGDGLPWANASRWDDGPYLARVVFQTMVGDDNGNTGFGISTRVIDNEHPIIVLDAEKEAVGIEGSEQMWPMADYCASTDPGKLIGFDSDE